MTDEQSEFVMRHAGGPPGPPGAKGPRGERGPKGETGARGLTSKTTRAIIFLFLLAFVTAGFSLLLTAHYVNAQQASQRRQGLQVEHSICETLGKLAALKPPAGAAAANPSRAYEQQLHATLDQLGPDLGCGK